MGLFNGYLNHPTEVSLKQISMEYGLVLVEGEFVEKAYKVGKDKFILTSRRLIMICQTKGGHQEFITVPYASIRKFSKDCKEFSDPNGELKIWLKDEMNPIRKDFRNTPGVNDVYQILSKYTLQFAAH